MEMLNKQFCSPGVGGFCFFNGSKKTNPQCRRICFFQGVEKANGVLWGCAVCQAAHELLN